MASRRVQRIALVWIVLSATWLPLAGCVEKDDLGPWSTFSPDGASFSVLMPGLPTEDRDVATKNTTGDIDFKSYTLELPYGGFLSVVVAELPEATVIKGNTDEILDSACAHIAQSAGGTVTGKRLAPLGDRPGREFFVDVPESAVPGGGALRAKVYLVDRTMYQLIAIVPRSKRNSDTPGKFLDSFTLVRKN